MLIKRPAQAVPWDTVVRPPRSKNGIARQPSPSCSHNPVVTVDEARAVALAISRIRLRRPARSLLPRRQLAPDQRFRDAATAGRSQPRIGLPADPESASRVARSAIRRTLRQG